jgi:hypothetical protein
VDAVPALQRDRPQIEQIGFAADDWKSPAKDAQDSARRRGGSRWRIWSHDRRVPIPRRQARSFQNTRKFSGTGFVSAKGHLGHMHVPGNSHIDPTTAFRGDKLLRLVKSGPHNIIEGK